jgi:hypothetical protein
LPTMTLLHLILVNISKSLPSFAIFLTSLPASLNPAIGTSKQMSPVNAGSLLSFPYLRRSQERSVKQTPWSVIGARPATSGIAILTSEFITSSNVGSSLPTTKHLNAPSPQCSITCPSHCFNSMRGTITKLAVDKYILIVCCGVRSRLDVVRRPNRVGSSMSSS